MSPIIQRTVVFVVVAVTACLPAFAARTRAASSVRGISPTEMPGAVQGTVTSVTGNVIMLANGLTAIDASTAKIMVGLEAGGQVAAIEPGMIVFAAVDRPSAEGMPLRASFVVATRATDLTLAGSIDSVDPVARTLTVLGQTVTVTDATTFPAPPFAGGVSGLRDLLPNQLVQVQADAAGTTLVARSVVALSGEVPQIAFARGTVVTIAPDTCVIRADDGSNFAVRIDAQTRIAGTPRPGSSVEVLYRTDEAQTKIAIAIISSSGMGAPSLPAVSRIGGTVVSMGSAEWVLRTEGGDARIVITERTRIEPGITAGDRVEVLGERRLDGMIAALLIWKPSR